MLAVPVTENPRLLARVARALYLIITVCALFAYLYVRGRRQGDSLSYRSV
jgi:hypothetical protein